MKVQNVFDSNLSKITPEQRKEIFNTINNYLINKGITSEEVNAITRINTDSSNVRKLGLVIKA